MNKVIDILNLEFFNQPHTSHRLAYIRIVLAFVAANEFFFGQFNSFTFFTASLMSNEFWLLHQLFFENEFYQIAIPTIGGISSLMFAIGFIPKITGPLTFILYTFCASIIYQMSPNSWNYNTYVIIFLGVIAFSNSCEVWSIIKQKKKDSHYSSFALGFIVFYTLFIYFQAGLAKLIFSGSSFFLSNHYVTTYLYINDFGLGPWLANSPILLSTGLFVILAFELLILFFYMFSSKKNWTLWILIGFHTLAFLTMRLSFLSLVILLPAIFWKNWSYFKKSPKDALAR